MFWSARSLFRINIPTRMNLTLQATLCTVRKAYVKKKDGDGFMSLAFNYSSPLMNEHSFNFVRMQSEQLKVLCKKISQSVKEQSEGWIRSLPVRERAAMKKELLLQNLKEIENVAVYIEGNEINGDALIKSAIQTGAVLRIGRMEFNIEVNCPSVTKITLPENMMAGFHVYPEVELEIADLKSSEFIWYRSDRQEKLTNAMRNYTDDVSELKWEQVGEGFSYLSSFDDFDRYLKVKCFPVELNGRRGDPVETISSALVQNGPGPCPFDKRHAFTRDFTKAGRFRIMSYNILADCYANTTFSRTLLFPSCPPHALNIDYRKHLLLKEIYGYNCDVICLQEVSTEMFNDILKPFFGYFNYEAKFTLKGENLGDGLACLYNKNKFSLVGQYNIRFSTALEKEPALADLLKEISKNDILKNKVLSRISSVQIAILKSLDLPNRKLCIANTHLFSNPESRNIRLAQAGILLRYLEEVIALESSKDPTCSIALVIAGDFNSLPEFGVYQLMTTQFIPNDHPDWKCVPGEEIENASLQHSFHLTSAYGTPRYTNYIKDFSGCLDYIFSDKSLLDVEEVVPLPSHEEVTDFLTLPSITFPSDHLALVCTLRWV